MKKLFITGIGTEVGKTVVSAIVVEALKADYWKPIQAGELEHSDSDKIKALISNTQTKIYPNSYALHTPMSPHAAADIDGINIQLDKIIEPVTSNTLIIEGAGGLLVPLNDTETVLGLLKEEYKIIVVSRHYLGSINHTLLTIEMLKRKGLHIAGIIFSGNEHPTTETIIQKMSDIPILGRVGEEVVFDKQVIKKYADLFTPILKKI